MLEDEESVQRVLSAWVESPWHFGNLQAPPAASSPLRAAAAGVQAARSLSLPAPSTDLPVQQQEEQERNPQQGQQQQILQRYCRQRAQGAVSSYSQPTSRLQARSVTAAVQHQFAPSRQQLHQQQQTSRGNAGIRSSVGTALQQQRHRHRSVPPSPSSYSDRYQRLNKHGYLADNLQDSVNIVMEAYMSMRPKPAPTPFEQPKGVNKLFVKLVCRPVSWFDLPAFTKGVASLLVGLSFLLAQLSVFLVPAWLWLLRNDLRHDGGKLLLLHAAAGAVVFIAADVLMRRSFVHSAKAAKRVVTAATVGPLLMQEQERLRLLHSNMSKVTGARGQQGNETQVAAAAAVPRQAGTGSQQQAAAVEAGSRRGPQQVQNLQSAPASAAAVGGQQQQRQAGGVHHGGTASEWHEVRLAVMQLQLDVYGVEQTEGLLPFEAVYSQAQTVCSDLGVAWPQGQVPPQTILKLLGAARQAAGFGA